MKRIAGKLFSGFLTLLGALGLIGYAALMGLALIAAAKGIAR